MEGFRIQLSKRSGPPNDPEDPKTQTIPSIRFETSIGPNREKTPGCTRENEVHGDGRVASVCHVVYNFVGETRALGYHHPISGVYLDPYRVVSSFNRCKDFFHG